MKQFDYFNTVTPTCRVVIPSDDPQVMDTIIEPEELLEVVTCMNNGKVHVHSLKGSFHIPTIWLKRI